MQRRAFAIGLLAGWSTARVGFAAPPPPPPNREDDGMRILRPDKPARWSSRCDAKTRRALLAGTRRLGIDVNAYKPPTSGAAIFVVRLRSADGARRREIDRFGVHPNAPFRVADGVEPQRFQISLADGAEFLDGAEIHVEVGFDTSRGRVEGGMAEVSIGLVDL